MSLDSLIADSGQMATITAEAADGRVPGRTSMGGADRSDANWLAVVSGVPCLVRPMGSSLAYNRNDARAGVNLHRIYFVTDPVPGGLSSRHRIEVDGAIYAVMGVQDPNSMGRILQVDCEQIRTP